MFATAKKPAFMKIYAIPLLTVMVQSMSGAIAILYALDLGANVLQVNLITTIRSTMGIFLLVPFALLLGGITSLVSPFANNYILIVIIFFFSGISYGATSIHGSTLVSNISTPENRGLANSLYNLAQSTGNITKARAR